MSETAKASRADRLAALGLPLAALYGVGMFNYWHPILRLTNPVANAFSFAFLQCIPLVLLTFALLAGPWWGRLLWSLFLLPLALLACLLGSCAVFHGSSILAAGTDASLEPLETIPVGAGRVSVYRTNGGATTSFGISVRQECSLAPGVLRVRSVFEAYPAYEVKAEVLSPEAIRFTAPPYGDRRVDETVQEVSLEPMLCPDAG